MLCVKKKKITSQLDLENHTVKCGEGTIMVLGCFFPPGWSRTRVRLDGKKDWSPIQGCCERPVSLQNIGLDHSKHPTSATILRFRSNNIYGWVEVKAQAHFGNLWQDFRNYVHRDCSSNLTECGTPSRDIAQHTAVISSKGVLQSIKSRGLHKKVLATRLIFTWPCLRGPIFALPCTSWLCTTYPIKIHNSLRL